MNHLLIDYPRLITIESSDSASNTYYHLVSSTRSMELFRLCEHHRFHFLVARTYPQMFLRDMHTILWVSYKGHQGCEFYLGNM